MRIRHEVLIDDLPLDADPDYVIALSDFNSNLSTELISISNYDELTQEDLPSLLLRQERDVDLDLSVTLEYCRSAHGRFIPADYSTDQTKIPATRIRRNVWWGTGSRAFGEKHPGWKEEVELLDSFFTQNAVTLYNRLRWSSGHIGNTGEDANRILLGRLRLEWLGSSLLIERRLATPLLGCRALTTGLCDYSTANRLD